MIKKYIIFSLIFCFQWIAAQEYTIKLVTGNEIDAIIPVIAQQWVEENARYPYLFKGDISIGIHYFEKWVKSEGAAVVIAVDTQDNIVGFLSGMPLCNFAHHYPSLEELFVKAELDFKSFYYFSDIIIKQEHRNRGLGKKFFELLEQHALLLGYTSSCLICESHPEGHPLKPKDYYELDNIWPKYGYQKIDMIITVPWDTIQPDGSVKLEDHIMGWWIKNLKK